MPGITTKLCNSFKSEILQGIHNLTSDEIKVALIKSNTTMVGTYDADTTNYSNVTGFSDEASGTGYTAGGNVLSSISISVDTTNDVAYVDIGDTTWASSSITAAGCIIYNNTQSGKAIAVINFVGDKTSTNGDFVIEFPPSGGGAPDYSNAIIRIA